MNDYKNIKDIHPFIKNNFKYDKGDTYYKTKCLACGVYYKSFMTGDNSNPIELFSYIENCVKEKKEKGFILIVSCPICDVSSAIDFRIHLNV